ncbi:DMT family transporter [Synechococcus sp. MIT S9503]|uniref:DMT family transporter n=1 Tax=Synechococcus sp. MIT S9503 TaxID=3082547 RepID=UPI0039A6310B
MANDSAGDHIARFDYSAVWFLVFGAIAGSFGGIFVKIAEESLSPEATIFNRFFIASLILITIRMPRFIASIKDDAFKIFNSKAQDIKTILLFLLCGLSGSLMHYAYCLSVAKAGIAISDLLLSMSPIVTAFFALYFLKEKLNSLFGIGLAIAIGGAIGIALGEVNRAPSAALGETLALSSAFFLGGYLLLIQRLRERFSAIDILTVVSIIISGFMLISTSISGHQLFPETLKGWISVVMLAVICQILGEGLIIIALEKLSAKLTSVLLLLDPVFAAILALIIFSEALTISSWLGLFVCVIGISLCTLSQSKS